MFAKIKGAWRSWTIWINGIATAVVVGLPSVQEALPGIQPYLSASAYKYLALVIVGANILLRFKTKAPLGQK